MKKNDLITKIITKAWKDPEFKKRFLHNPKAVLKEMGVDLPANLKIRVIEDDAEHLTIVLPPAPVSSKHLHEAELEELAAGGKITIHNCKTFTKSGGCHPKITASPELCPTQYKPLCS